MDLSTATSSFLYLSFSLLYVSSRSNNSLPLTCHAKLSNSLSCLSVQILFRRSCTTFRKPALFPFKLSNYLVSLTCNHVLRTHSFIHFFRHPNTVFQTNRFLSLKNALVVNLNFHVLYKLLRKPLLIFFFLLNKNIPSKIWKNRELCLKACAVRRLFLETHFQEV